MILDEPWIPGPKLRNVHVQEPQDLIVARTFNYEGEAACDRHMQTFLTAIKAAAAAEGQGFVAIKVWHLLVFEG